ncbi:hypothetical protein [Nitrosococcus halophilus]|uniref:hypothetical protein n=1 Tax=Nitrosococcus halophilus TaxID=133539 RepID=UPI00059E689E|nr:hypothetical protein [Nitrosococcus halophilus]
MKKPPIQKTNHATYITQHKRVLLVSPQPFYEERGTPIAVRHILVALGQLGYKVDLITYPIGEKIELPSVKILRIPNPFGFKSIPIGFSFKKIFLDVMLTVLFYKQFRNNHYLCIHVLEEMAFPVALLARRKKVFVVYDMASSLPEQLSHSFFLAIRFVKKYLDI